MPQTSPVLLQGLSLDALAHDLGLAPARVQWRQIKSVKTEREDRQVLLLEHDDDAKLVVKQEPGLSARRFDSLLESYGTLGRALGDDGAFRMVPVILARPEDRLVVLAHVPGLTAHARLEAAEIGLDQRAEVIESCAAWLGQLHRASSVGVTAFEGGDVLHRVRKFARDVREGVRPVAYPKRFLGLCAFMHKAVRGAEGAPRQQALRHGDAHSRNFIFGAEALFAVDPTPRGAGPVALDIARYMTRLAYSFGVAEEGAGHAGLARADWQALATGYEHPWEDDPVLTVFLGLQLLNDWVQMPDAREQRTSSQQHRLSRLVTMFQLLREQCD